jgi:hypothetical protein
MSTTIQIAKHLNVSHWAITKVEEWAKVMFVVVKGLGSRFVSKKVVKKMTISFVEMVKALESQGYKIAWKTSGMGGEQSISASKDKQVFHVSEWANNKIQVHHQSVNRNRLGSLKKETVSKCFVDSPGEAYEAVVNAVPVIKPNEKQAIIGILTTPEEDFQ